MPTMTHNEEYMTLEEAADELGIALRTVRLYIARGMLRGYKQRSGKGVQFVSRAEVAALHEIVPVDRPSQPDQGDN